MSQQNQRGGRWAQRAEQKASLYARTDEKAQTITRTQRATDRYTPHVGNDQWRGQAWGLASAQVRNRQKKKKELFYGEKRSFNLEAPPEDPGNSFLTRVTQPYLPQLRATHSEANGRHEARWNAPSISRICKTKKRYDATVGIAKVIP